MAEQRTVLLAWELGAGLGHARRLLTIAVALQRRGWSPVVVARELWGCAEEYREASIPVFQAPRDRGLRFRELAGFKARSFADVLAVAGYADAQSLRAMLLCWANLIDVLRPRVIIADFAPVLALAAYERVPVLSIGDGFVLPPPHLPQMPLLRRDGTKMPAEPELLALAASIRGAIPASLPALIGGRAHVVCTYPETDIYADLRLQPASGPINGAFLPLAEAKRTAIFAYLAADFPPTAKLLQILATSGLPVEVFVRDVTEQMARALRASNVHVHEQPPPLPEVAMRSSLIVHHGGVGTIEASLALGRPQVLLPRHFEQTLNAANLLRLGLAMRLREGFSLADGAALVSEAISSKSMAESACDIAARLAGRPNDSLDRVIFFSEELAKL